MAQDTGVAAFQSLGADLNKPKGNREPDETDVGIVSEKLPELTLSMTNEDLVKLTDKWEKVWRESPKKTEWLKKCDEAENYWLGKQFNTPDADKDRPMVDNLIFEALETYLPQATRRNPEALVELREGEDEDETNEKYVLKVKNRLADLADENKIRLKLKKAGRHWAIYLLGVGKAGWDLDKDIPIIRIIRPKRMILDPDATIDEDGYTGDRVGEYRKLSASRLLEIIGEGKGTADARTAINDLIKNDDKAEGTKIQFIEWWTPQYTCWKLNETILRKSKNPHWNYDEEPLPDVDDYGNDIEQPGEPIKGNNHFTVPKMPYIFLSVFQVGDQPMDKTSLIVQNLANQDLINKRNKQIDKNADRMNGGMVVSLARSGLTQGQAKMVTAALRKGGVVTIPDGSPRDAIDTYNPGNLPSDVYSQLADTRARLRDIFGVSGTSQAGLEDEDTVRGKILSRNLDTDRIGGGVTEYLEQFADDAYNWFLQLLYVYDSDFQFIEGATPPKLKITVKEGSLLPKDSVSIANQAMELARNNRISNLDLYRRLEWPNPEELAANAWLEQNAPHLLYADNPAIAQAVAAAQGKAEDEAAGGGGAQPPENLPTEKRSGSILSEVPESEVQQT